MNLYSDDTCGEACWTAREDVCRCSCHGKNHGILRTGGPRPPRTCKIGGYWYKMHAITISGENEARTLNYKVAPAGYIPYHYAKDAGMPYLCKPATESQKKWQEVAILDYVEIAKIIWKRITDPLDESMPESALYFGMMACRDVEYEREQKARYIPEEYGITPAPEAPDTAAAYPMVEGEGAPQYTFDLPEETQLALL